MRPAAVTAATRASHGKLARCWAVRLLFVHMVNRASDEGLFWESRANTAAVLGMSEDAIKKGRQDLRALGYIESVMPAVKGFHPQVWRVLPPSSWPDHLPQLPSDSMPPMPVRSTTEWADFARSEIARRRAVS